MIASESIYSPRSTHRCLGTVSQIILSLAVTSLALPRDALADDTQVLEPVVVTATRVNTPVSEAPAAVSVVTDEQMERRDVSRIGDALTDIPGVFIRGSAFGEGTPGSTVGAITLRGIPGNGRTMLAVDGRSMDTGYNAQINYSAIDLDDVERIEVVPGPFSSLYGGSAFAGVINAITKVPDKREVIIKSGVGGGDALVERGSMVYRDRIDRLGVSVGIGGTNSDGYADEFATGTAPTGTTGWSRIPTSTGGTTQLLGGKGPKPWDEEHGHFTLFLDPTDSMQLTTGVSYSQTQVNFGSPNSYLRNAAGASVLDTGSGFVVYEPSKETATRVFAKSETEIAPKTILKTDLAYSAFGFWYDSPKNTANVNNGVGMQYTAPTTRVEGTVQLDRAIGSWNTSDTGYLRQAGGYA
jgi:iron complex outermembrane receptor protein